LEYLSHCVCVKTLILSLLILDMKSPPLLVWQKSIKILNDILGKRIIDEMKKIIYYKCITFSFLSLDAKRRFVNE